MCPVTNNSVPSPQAYTYSAPAGIAGAITRADESSVEPAMLEAISSVFANAFGIPMVYASDGAGIQQWGASNVAADLAGFLVRQAPAISENGDGLGGAPNPVQVQGLMVRGYMNVVCVYGTPVRGQLVYVRTVANSNNETVGTLDATADAGNNVALTTAGLTVTWASNGKDSNNNAELRVAR